MTNTNGLYRLTILYGRPADPAAFDAYYRDTHLPIARRMLGLADWRLQWLEPGRDGAPPPYHLVVDLYATSRQALFDVLDSPEGLAAAEDVGRFADGGVTYLYGPEQRVSIS
jgi:uncharacterized protein (TIGR02118 family)